MSLTEEQVAHYYREGYVLVPSLVPERAVSLVLSASHRYAYATQCSSVNARLAETGNLPDDRLLASELGDRWRSSSLLGD